MSTETGKSPKQDTSTSNKFPWQTRSDRQKTLIEKILYGIHSSLGIASTVLLLFLAIKFYFKKLHKLNELFDMFYYVYFASCIAYILNFLYYFWYVEEENKVRVIISYIIVLIILILFLGLYSQRKKYSFKKNRIIVLVHVSPLILFGSIIALILTLYGIMFIIKILGSVGNK